MAKNRKPKKCRICEREYTPRSTIQVVCSPTCAYEKVKRDKAKKALKQINLQSKLDKKARLDLNRQDIKWQHEKTQKVFNRMRVLQELKWYQDRGLEPVCISCQNPLGGDQWCCGHFKTRGAQSGLRYDEKNTYLQHNYRCNMHLSGDIEGTKDSPGYKKGLIIRFGEIEGQEIIDYCEKNVGSVKWTWQELEEKRKVFNQIIRDLERDLQ